ncbi:MAG: flagellar export chaperone FliS [candidate division Zixibacteria bacterium]|nr:flagellar export chaperone FliS [candidate division Zixibacteria bacterium]
MNNQVKTYQQMHISGLNQKELIVLLYSGALRFIEEGKELIAKKDVPQIHDRLNRARNIFIHLLSTLNLEAGGEFADKLSALYAYFIEKITMANTTKNVEDLNEIIPLIQEIKESWEKIDIADNELPENQKSNGLKQVQVFSAEV